MRMPLQTSAPDREDALASLTEKERETLRLIVRGHGAKSAANELDLSVHTVNERLRAARRKLSVTSSREAARLLLEQEAGGHENPVYKQLGDEPSASPSDIGSPSQQARKRAIWIGGIGLMFSIALAAALVLSGHPASERQVGDPATAIETVQLEEFERSARAWLSLVDAFDWEASYAAAGRSLQEPNTVATWRDASLQARVPLGAVVEREITTAEYVNAPPHGYVVVNFRSQFEKSGASDRVGHARKKRAQSGKSSAT